MKNSLVVNFDQRIDDHFVTICYTDFCENSQSAFSNNEPHKLVCQMTFKMLMCICH